MSKFHSKNPKRVGRPKMAEQQGQLSTRERILQAAEALFIERGYAAVSINEITQRVEITKPTLYHYFGDKDNLYATVMEELLEKIGDHIQEALAQDLPLPARLNLLAHGYHETCRMCLTYLLKDSIDNLGTRHCEAVRQALNRHILGPLESFYASAMAAGTVRHDNPRTMAELTISALDGLYLLHAFEEPEEVDLNRVVASSIEVFLRQLEPVRISLAEEVSQPSL